MLDQTNTNTLHITAPSYALNCLRLLEDSGWETWFVGGFVRNSLLKIEVSDIDMCSQALWNEAQETLENNGIHCIPTGAKHGTITAICEGQPLEITTFRREGNYLDNRHPSEVIFCTDIKEDLKRRDFTINALAWHPKRGLIDCFNGIDDLNNNLLRCVGDPNTRFQEDALRILRGLRLASCYGFVFEENTRKALFEEKMLLNNIASERIFSEMTKLLCGKYAMQVLKDYFEIFTVIMPELAPMKDFDQHNAYHKYDVLDHTLHVLDNSPQTPRSRWAALFHDIGKPNCFNLDENGVGHFGGHPKEGAKIAQDIMKRLKFPRNLSIDVRLLVALHDWQIPLSAEGVLHGLDNFRGDPSLLCDLYKLKQADELSKANTKSDRYELACQLEKLLKELLDQNFPLSVKQLEISGDDLIDQGWKPGPDIGRTLNRLLHACAKGKVENNKEQLLSYLKREESPAPSGVL